MREALVLISGVAGGMVAAALGGCDALLRALFFFIAVDFLSGLILAGVFKKSAKCEHGALESRVGIKGFIKKFMMLVAVTMAYQFDTILGAEYIRNAAIIAIIVNESISIIENMGLMGVKIPGPLKDAIGILRKKGGDKNA